MDMTNLGWAAAIAGGVAAASAVFRPIKTFFTTMRSWFFVTTRMQDRVSSRLTLQWFFQNTTRILAGDMLLESQAWYVKSANCTESIFFEIPDTQPMWFRDGWRIYCVRAHKFHTDYAFVDADLISVTTLRWWFQRDAWVRDIHKGDTKAQRFCVVRVTGKDSSTLVQAGMESRQAKPEERQLPSGRCITHDRVDIGTSVTPNFVKGLLRHKAYLAMLAQMRFWLDHKQWFVDHGIPWRRGVLAHGAPGGGKTAAVVGAAAELDLPVYVPDLASMSNRELVENWQTFKKEAPVVVVFEDLHKVFHGSENITKGSLSFDCFLNTIGGADMADGVFTVATTNDTSLLDPALATGGETTEASRPGRLDAAVEFGPLTLEDKRELFRRMGTEVDETDEAEFFNKELLAAQAVGYMSNRAKHLLEARDLKLQRAVLTEIALAGGE